jgi:hypothetical protein
MGHPCPPAPKACEADYVRNATCVQPCADAAAALRVFADGLISMEVLEDVIKGAFHALDAMDWDSWNKYLVPIGFGVLVLSRLLEILVDVSLRAVRQEGGSECKRNILAWPQLNQVLKSVLPAYWMKRYKSEKVKAIMERLQNSRDGLSVLDASCMNKNVFEQWELYIKKGCCLSRYSAISASEKCADDVAQIIQSAASCSGVDYKCVANFVHTSLGNDIWPKGPDGFPVWEEEEDDDVDASGEDNKMDDYDDDDNDGDDDDDNDDKYNDGGDDNEDKCSAK